ncbi:MAG TPA: hypothetical protein VFB29_00355 [Pseudolabrys sp.]|nr:hypothetical protein [Pseudolabrys sp.]
MRTVVGGALAIALVYAASCISPLAGTILAVGLVAGFALGVTIA